MVHGVHGAFAPPPECPGKLQSTLGISRLRSFSFRCFPPSASTFGHSGAGGSLGALGARPSFKNGRGVEEPIRQWSDIQPQAAVTVFARSVSRQQGPQPPSTAAEPSVQPTTIGPGRRNVVNSLEDDFLWADKNLDVIQRSLVENTLTGSAAPSWAR